MSRRFERVVRFYIDPNEFYPYAELIEALNRLSLGILENFARVSFRFLDVENLQHKGKALLYVAINVESLPSLPSSTTQAVYKRPTAI